MITLLGFFGFLGITMAFGLYLENRDLKWQIEQLLEESRS